MLKIKKIIRENTRAGYLAALAILSVGVLSYCFITDSVFGQSGFDTASTSSDGSSTGGYGYDYQGNYVGGNNGYNADGYSNTGYDSQGYNAQGLDSQGFPDPGQAGAQTNAAYNTNDSSIKDASTGKNGSDGLVGCQKCDSSIVCECKCN